MLIPSRPVIVKPELGTQDKTECRDSALKTLGYIASGEAPSREIDRILSASLRKAFQLAEPRGVYAIHPISHVGRTSIRIPTGTLYSARFARLAASCRGPRAIVVMAATLGDVERGIKGRDPDMSRRFVLDAVCSAVAEMVANRVERRWRAYAASKEMQSSQRFSPGYCDWNLEGQRLVFDSLPMERIGVRLTPAFVVQPAKTVTAVAVIAQDVPVPDPCTFCRKKDCQMRKHGVFDG